MVLHWNLCGIFNEIIQERQKRRICGGGCCCMCGGGGPRIC